MKSESTKIAELHALAVVRALATESLNPDSFEDLERVFTELAHTRKLNEPTHPATECRDCVYRYVYKDSFGAAGCSIGSSFWAAARFKPCWKG